MLIAATNVISAAVVPSVPHPAAGIATGASAAPAMRRRGIPEGLRVIRRGVSIEAADVGRS